MYSETGLGGTQVSLYSYHSWITLQAVVPPTNTSEHHLNHIHQYGFAAQKGTTLVGVQLAADTTANKKVARTKTTISQLCMKRRTSHHSIPTVLDRDIQSSN